MPSPLLTLWIDVQNNTLLSNWETASTTQLPTLKQGDSIKVEVHLVRTSNGGSYMEEVEVPSLSTIKMAIGRNDQKPTAGYLVFTYDGDSVNIPVSSTAAQANALVNGLASIIAAGGIVLTIVNQSTYRVVFNEVGIRPLVTCISSNLRPTSTVWVKEIVAGSSVTKAVQHIKPKVIPIAYSDNFLDSILPSITQTSPSPSITRLSISPAPKYGSFFISNGTKTTPSISINATSDDVLAALTTCGINDASDVPTGNVYTVIKIGPNDWDLNRISGNIENLVAFDNGLIGFKSKVGIISLNNEEVEDFLAGASSSVGILEVEVSDNTSNHTVYQGSITIVNDLIDNQTYEPTDLPALLSDAPSNGILYGRKDNDWQSIPPVDLSNYLTKDGGFLNTSGNIQVFGGGSEYAVFSANAISVSITNPSITEYATALNAQYVMAVRNTGIPSIMFMNADGLQFPDSTTQTTAAVTFDPTGYATESWVTSQGYLTSSSLTGYATQSWVTSQGYLTSSALTGYATQSWVTGQGYLINGDNGTVPAGGLVGQVLTKASGSNYSFIWSSPIVGDRYLATSTTSNEITIGVKTFTIQTGLSYTPQQDIIIAYDSANHMHGVVTSYDSLTGVLVVDITNKTGNGIHTSWTVNVGGTAPLQTLAWGGITGTLSSQTDLQSALDVKANLSGATFSGKVNTPASTATNAGLNIGAGTAPTTPVSGDLWMQTAGNYLYYRAPAGVTYTLCMQQFSNTFSAPQIIDTTSNTLAGLRVTQKGTQPALIVEDSLNPDSTAFVIKGNTGTPSQNGCVGIGFPSTFTAVGKLDVNGLITSTTPADKTNSTVVATTAFVKSSVVPTIVNASTSPYNITTSLNWNTIIRSTATSAININIYPDATYNMEIGTQIVVIQVSSSTVTFVNSGGVTLLSAGGKYKTNGQNSIATLIKTAANEWILAGDLKV